MSASFEELATCGLCDSIFEESMQLPCMHAFCKSCLASNKKEGKITCPICNSVYNLSTGKEDTFKTSVLSEFWVNLHSDYFDDLKLTSEERAETEGICSECAPPPHQKTKTPAENTVEPEPLEVKLKMCIHCKKSFVRVAVLDITVFRDKRL